MLIDQKKSLSLRSYEGKKLVSYLRQGDYAHPGETEAIHMVMAKYPKDATQIILDVGCGLGGTADFIQKNGWGKVIGVDIETSSMTYAKQHYPNVEFHCVDALQVGNIAQINQFDIAVLFNSFYAFKNQNTALSSLQKKANNQAKLALFDYSTNSSNEIGSLKKTISAKNIFNPINIDNIEPLLLSCGWSLVELIDISDVYKKWYSTLLINIEKKKEQILLEFDHPTFNTAYAKYTALYNALLCDKLGGCIVYAEKRG